MEPGIYSTTREEYDKLPYVNQSLLKAADRSMAHAKAYLDGYRKDSDTLAFGAANHVYVLERERFDSVYQVMPKMRRAGAAWEKACADAAEAGKEPLFAEDVATFEAMRTALLAESRRRAIATTKGEYEITLVWDDKRTGLRCKGRIDKLIRGITTAVDLKKTRDARERAFGRAAADYGYALQAAFYMDGLEAVTGKPHKMVYLCQEDEPPYASAMYRVMPNTQAYLVGRWQYRNTLAALAQCKKTNIWPGYGDDVNELVLPAWAVPQGMMEDEDGNRASDTGTQRGNPYGVGYLPPELGGEPLAAG